MSAAMLASNRTVAQPREPPPPWVDPAGPPTAMDVWLRRLVGRYTFDGMIKMNPQAECSPEVCQGVKGKGDCVGVGAGPGVHCVLNLAWRDMYGVDFESGTVSAPPGAISYLNPAMALFGLDPGQSAIHYLLVDNKGLPEGGLGASSGHRATFRTPCVNTPVGCDRVIRIEAKPDATLLYMWIDAETGMGGDKNPASTIMLSLRRVPQDQVSAETGAPK